MSPPPRVTIPQFRGFEPPRQDDQLVSVSVSPAGDAVAMWASEPERLRLLEQEHLGIGIFPRPRPDEPAEVRVTIDSLHARRSVQTLAVRTNFPTLHLLPGGRILVVGGRARWRPEGPDHNAYIYAADGSLERSACVGDGIEHVAKTSAGFIWIGYFDEGVFGNLGWGGPGPAPIGAPGLNRFDATLTLDWSHPGREICDCYALTTSDEECFACPYTDWSVLQVTGAGRLSTFTNEIAGATAMMEHSGRLALVGGYRQESDRVVVGTLMGGTFRVEASGRLQLGESGAWTATTVIGRDGALHAFEGTTWHQIRLRDLARGLGV